MITKKQLTSLVTLLSMPQHEVEYLSNTNSEQSIADLETYRKCKETGNMDAWNKLKRFRAKAIVS